MIISEPLQVQDLNRHHTLGSFREEAGEKIVIIIVAVAARLCACGKQWAKQATFSQPDGFSGLCAAQRRSLNQL